MNDVFPTYYPINDFGPLMKGLVIGGVAIVHVFLAQFAVGGGFLMCYFQWLGQTGREPLAKRFVAGYFKVLVLISFVAGALTGVGIWFTSIQVSAPTIGAMIREFHWLWATEWTFFCLEIVAGYAFYRYQSQLSDRTALQLLLLYAGASWASLYLINGIISWQLTPGVWPHTGNVWDGFYNPSFWPSLLFRTVVSLTLAALVACVVINTMSLDREASRRLINRAAHFLFPMLIMPLLGIWYVTVMPEDSRAWLFGGSVAMNMFLNLTVAASMLVGGYALFGLVRKKLYINGATATLLCVLAFGASAGGEFMREGVRKPFSVRDVMYSNSILPAQVATLRKEGSVSRDPYPLQDEWAYPQNQLRLGAKVYRFQCSICHTLDGANALHHLTDGWSLEQKRLNIAMLQHTKPFMPPFSGTQVELEALAQFLTWHNAGRPPEWPMQKDPQVLKQIESWLAEAGTKPTASNNPPLK